MAHIYGQNLVAAESLTVYRNAWAYSPETLKSTADRMMANGLNRFIIHTSVHQPVDDKIPGLGLGPFGQWFTRHETWAEMARPWTTYLSRSSFMLQQGKFVADIAYFYGEDSNVTALFGAKMPDIPAGYRLDFVNADALINRLSVKDGRIVTATGMSYSLLALDPNSRHMSLAVLRKIRDLVRDGAAVVGPKPIDSPSLADDQAEFRSIADELWGPGSGKGKVLGDQTVAQALASIGVSPDIEFTKPREDTALMFVHRALPDGDLYWVVNGNTRPETLEVSFRVTGKEPELWHAETGLVEPASYLIANGRTIVPLRLTPDDAVFVVFRKASTAPARALARSGRNGPDDDRRPLGCRVPGRSRRAGQGRLRNPELLEHEPRSRDQVFFRRRQLTRKTVEAPAEWFKPGAKLWLDLGDVKNLAEVSINGQALGTLWKTPFRMDVTSALKPGANTLEIKVANLWVNRLIGDKQPGVAKTYTYTAVEFYKADSPLLPSGLLGPVKIVKVE